MTGQVIDQDGGSFELRQNTIGKFMRRAIILVPCKAVSKQDNLFNRGAIAEIQLAMNILSAFVYLKILFNCVAALDLLL